MPTRRIFEVALAVAILARPAFGLARLWAAKTVGTTPDGTFLHETAEIVMVIA